MAVPAPALRAGVLDLLTEAEIDAAPEILAMQRLLAAGMPCGWLVVPAALEERFYRFTNLPARLRQAFAEVDPDDPDEDLVEEAAEAAADAFAQSFLLDEAIDAFYAGLEGLAASVLVRRAASVLVRRADAGPSRTAARGRPALLAWKRLYADDWSVDAVMARLRARRSLALDARPVVVHDAAEHGAPELDARAGHVLGSAVRLHVDTRGAFVRITPVVPEAAD